MKVTVVEPPAAGGAPVLLFVNTPLQPPTPLAIANHVAKAALTCAWVSPNDVVVFAGQFSVTLVGAATVKVAWQVVVAAGHIELV